MSSYVTSEGPWLEALGATRRLSECRVFRNPSFSLRRVKMAPRPAARQNSEDGSPASGWNRIKRRWGSRGSGAGMEREKVKSCVFSRPGCVNCFKFKEIFSKALQAFGEGQGKTLEKRSHGYLNSTPLETDSLSWNYLCSIVIFNWVDVHKTFWNNVVRETPNGMTSIIVTQTGMCIIVLVVMSNIR